MKFIILWAVVIVIMLSIQFSTADDPQCGPNEHIQDDGFDCQTCKNYQYVRCARLGRRQCYCLPQHVRSESGGSCVAIADCPI